MDERLFCLSTSKKEVDKPQVTDRTYPMSETPEAFRCLEEEHARGKVVIVM